MQHRIVRHYEGLHEHVLVVMVFCDIMSQADNDDTSEAFSLYISLWMVCYGGKVFDFQLSTDWKNLLKSSGSSPVRSYARITNGTISWSRNRFGTCDAVFFDVGIAFVCLL